MNNDPQDLLKSIVSALMPDPDDVRVTCTRTRSVTVLSIDVPSEHRGKIIGRGGCIIESLKTLFHVIGAKSGDQIILEIDE